MKSDSVDQHSSTLDSDASLYHTSGPTSASSSITVPVPSNSSPRTGQRSVPNHTTGIRRPFYEIVVVTLGFSNEDGVAEVKRLIQDARIRINGKIDRKARRLLEGSPHMLVEILAADISPGEAAPPRTDDNAPNERAASSFFARGTRPVFDIFGTGRTVLRSAIVRPTILMMNKQDQCVTAVVDAQYRTVMDVLKQSSVYRPEMEHHVRPVGRLDMNTTGLLLFTDDGDLHRRVLLPEHHVPKRYLCTLRDEACAADVEAFANGVTIALPHEKERVCQPAWSRIDPTNARSVELEIGEGANHQVKRMWQLRGNKVVELKRISMGSLQLDPCLAPGEVRHLTVDEARLLYASAQFSHSFFATCIPPPDA